MDPPKTTSSETAFALTGRVEGRQKLFVLKNGPNTIGRSSDNEVVLPATGVSGRHAVIEVDEESLELRDLASKNGTFLAGKRTVNSRIEVGQLVQFGPVTLRLEQIGYEDTWLSVAAAEPNTGSRRPLPQTSTFVWTGESKTTVAQHWLRLLDTVTSELGAVASGAQGRALAALSRGLGTSRAALLELSPDGGPLVLASYGDLVGGMPLELMAELRAEAVVDGKVRVETVEGSGARWTVIVGSSDPVLVLEGAFASDGIAVPLLRILHRMLGRAGIGADEPSPVGKEARARLRFPDDYLPGESPVMQAVYREIGSVIDSDIPLLLVGETGVGKECLAKTVHQSSQRRDGPFLPINCAAIPADLLEAELFGIAKGVATGVQERAGRLVIAQGGTVFLDEIGDMSPDLQAKLLRALEERVVQPVGGAQQQIDVRLIAATNTDLGRKVETGEFRRDLYYRLAGLVVTIPALRDRSDDVAALIAYFFHQTRDESGLDITGLTYGAMRRLTERRWQGNVRELRHAVRRLVLLCPEGRAIDSGMVMSLENSVLSSAARPSRSPEGDFSDWESLDLDEASRGLIGEALKRCGGNQTSAAALLGISRSSLRRRLIKLFPDGGATIDAD